MLFGTERPPPPRLPADMAIRHLHEAEDESQEFSTLHSAIRAARKAYQTDGTMPDWEALADAAEAVRWAVV